MHGNLLNIIVVHKSPIYCRVSLQKPIGKGILRVVLLLSPIDPICHGSFLFIIYLFFLFGGSFVL